MRYKAKPKSYLIVTLITCIMLAAVIFLMQYVQELLLSDIRLSLSEIVTQNKDVITSKLTLELNNLNSISQMFSSKIQSKDDLNEESLQKLFLDFSKDSDKQIYYFADTEGTVISWDNQLKNIAGRNYFKLALQGETNVSEQLVSRFTGEDIFVISVPVYFQNEIIGTMQRQYPPKEMYELCSVSLFSQQGSMFIINKDGYILITSENESYNESSNYYRAIYLFDSEASIKLQNDIAEEKSGFMEIKKDGKTTFSAYTPINIIHDWYLITSIDTGVIIPNVNHVIQLFYFILFLITIVFSYILLYNIKIKNKQKLHLEKLAFVDNITGGNTYTKFADIFPTLLSDDCDYYILVFDIDGFRYINRFYGFDSGDYILKYIYNLCESKLLDGEILARSNSDRFVAAIKRTDYLWLEDILCNGIIINDINVYFSSGIYPVNDKTESLNLMIDKAILASNNTKGSRFKKIGIFSAVFDENLAKAEQLKRKIDNALANDEFVPFFQPKVNINTNTLVGAEALARWIKKDGTIVPPIEFIPISEQTGVIRSIDWAVFSKTLQFIKSNLDKDIKCVPISVNFSRVHIFDHDFIPKLKSLLEEYQVPGNLIEIELTETTIFDNSKDVNAFIDKIHDLNIQVSMDDFGSGYSSLHMLKDINIDILKVDQGFLLSASNDRKQQIIFETIIQMAKKLSLKTVAEGVETSENVETLKSAGCIVAQGYHYAKPMNSNLFRKIYEKGEIV